MPLPSRSPGQPVRRPAYPVRIHPHRRFHQTENGGTGLCRILTWRTTRIRMLPRTTWWSFPTASSPRACHQLLSAGKTDVASVSVGVSFSSIRYGSVFSLEALLRLRRFPACGDPPPGPLHPGSEQAPLTSPLVCQVRIHGSVPEQHYIRKRYSSVRAEGIDIPFRSGRSISRPLAGSAGVGKLSAT